MGAWNFTTGLVLIVVFLNSVPALEAIPNGNCSHGFQRDILLDMRQTEPEASEEDAQVVIDFYECIAQWRATVDEPCISKNEFYEKWDQLDRTHGGDVPWSEFKAVAVEMCLFDVLRCSAARKCEWRDSTMDSSTCDLSGNPNRELAQNCDRENKAIWDLSRRLDKARVTAPSLIQLIMVMAVLGILIVILIFLIFLIITISRTL